MSQPQQINIEELRRVATEVAEKVKELGLDVKLGGELKKLENIIEDLRDWTNKCTTFRVRPNYWLSIEKVSEGVGYFVVEGRVVHYIMKLNKKVGETMVLDVYREFFNDINVMYDLFGKLVETLESIVKVVKDNYDIIGTLRYVEDRLWELERSDP